MYTGSPAYHARGNHTPGQRPHQPCGINAIPLGIRGNFSPVGTPLHGNSPNTWDSSFSTPNNYFRPKGQHHSQSISRSRRVRGRAPPLISGFPRGGATGIRYGQGTGRWTGNKGKDSHQFTSAESRPDLFYVKSMVEDPWEPLKPIIWKLRYPPLNSYDTRNSPKPWLPNSISTKKAKVGEAPTNSTPQKSLAEYLAAAFDEAAGKEASNDESGS